MLATLFFVFYNLCVVYVHHCGRLVPKLIVGFIHRLQEYALQNLNSCINLDNSHNFSGYSVLQQSLHPETPSLFPKHLCESKFSQMDFNNFILLSTSNLLLLHISVSCLI